MPSPWADFLLALQRHFLSARGSFLGGSSWWIQVGSPAALAAGVQMEGKGAGTPGGQVSVLRGMGGF